MVIKYHIGGVKLLVKIKTPSQVTSMVSKSQVDNKAMRIKDNDTHHQVPVSSADSKKGRVAKVNISVTTRADLSVLLYIAITATHYFRPPVLHHVLYTLPQVTKLLTSDRHRNSFGNLSSLGLFFLHCD